MGGAHEKLVALRLDEAAHFVADMLRLELPVLAHCPHVRCSMRSTLFPWTFEVSIFSFFSSRRRDMDEAGEHRRTRHLVVHLDIDYFFAQVLRH